MRIRSRAFLVATVLLCALIVTGGIVAAVVDSDDDAAPNYEIALVGDAAEFDDALNAVAREVGVEVTLSSVSSRSVADGQVLDGTVDAVVDIGAAEFVSQSDPPADLAALVDLAWRSTRAAEAAAEAGLTGADAAAILSPTPLQPVALAVAPAPSDPVREAVGMAIGVLLFMSINLFGSYVLMGVIEEKSTGVIEVLLAQLRPRHLLAGKVLGIGAVAMVQMIAVVVSGVIALRISGVEVPADVWVAVPSALFWFIGGFVLYNTLFAVAGSMVSRVEDAQSASAPITVMFLGAYLAVFMLESGSTAAAVASVLPPFAPLLMPLRIATGTATWWQIVIAAVFLTLAAGWMLRLAGAIYARTLLHRGARMRWREALADPASPGMP